MNNTKEIIISSCVLVVCFVFIGVTKPATPERPQADFIAEPSQLLVQEYTVGAGVLGLVK